MNVLGFSKREREIHIHQERLGNILFNIFRKTDTMKVMQTGSTSDGMRGGIYNSKCYHDNDRLFTTSNIKLCPPRTNNNNNPPRFLLHDNDDYDASFFVEEDDNFPGYVKLSLAEVKTNSVYLDHCRRMNDGKQYLSNSVIIDSFCEPFIKLSIDGQMPFLSSQGPFQKGDRTGPAHRVHHKSCRGVTTTTDIVECIHYAIWPNSVNSFITRPKSHDWPSNSIIGNIQSQGCDVVPVGHHDSQNSDIQWRISFPGEQSLLLDLTDVQILCYALIKIILRENLNTSQREVVSSFHIKHVMFWCVELCSCQWVDSNYINCLNVCLTKLIEKIKARHIPHYIRESRNLFSSKMTETMSKEIVDVLSKYDTTHVFESVFQLTHYNNALLKREALISTIMACFNACFHSFNYYLSCSSYFRESYIPHNATISLLNYDKILQNLNKEKGVAIEYAMYLVNSMMGFLYYVRYKESNKTEFLLEATQLINKSLDLDNSCVKLRAATFFLTNLEYSKSIELCDTFLNFPPRHHQWDSDCDEYECVNDIRVKVREQLYEGKTTEDIEDIMKKILSMLYRSLKLKSLPTNCDIAQHTPVWIFRNITNITFHDISLDLIFMTAEKWAVPDPILYELLSLPKNAYCKTFRFSGVFLDPMLVCMQTKLLCYHLMGDTNGMDEMLTLMTRFITQNPFTIASLNMLAYCQIKAGHHRKSVKFILISLRIFPSWCNAASGYLKIVLQILNSLSI
jgi:hypothetical protein